MQSYSSQRNTTIADFQQIQVSTTLSKSSKWKVIEKAFPAPQLWTSTPKNHPTRYCIYTGGLIHQETPDTSSFQWAEAPQRFCTPSQRGCRSRLTICQLNQFITNSEAAMLSTLTRQSNDWIWFKQKPLFMFVGALVKLKIDCNLLKVHVGSWTRFFRLLPLAVTVTAWRLVRILFDRLSI